MVSKLSISQKIKKIVLDKEFNQLYYSVNMSHENAIITDRSGVYFDIAATDFWDKVGGKTGTERITEEQIKDLLDFELAMHPLTGEESVLEGMPSSTVARLNVTFELLQKAQDLNIPEGREAASLWFGKAKRQLELENAIGRNGLNSRRKREINVCQTAIDLLGVQNPGK